VLDDVKSNECILQLPGFPEISFHSLTSRTGACMSVYTNDLAHRFILVVEDEAMTAIDVASIISMAGGRVIGPFQSVSQGFLFRRFKRIDAALLDISLNGESVFKLADAIAERGIPIVFLSGHSPDVLPTQYRQRHFLPKPCDTQSVISALKSAISGMSSMEKRSA
jgi:FixJ family two-component response regulator